MTKKPIFSAVLGILGLLLAFFGGITKHAYETGYSYVASNTKEAISNAQTCIYIGI